MNILRIFSQAEIPNGEAPSDLTNFPPVTADETQLQNILAVVFGVAAALAIIVILISAISMVTGGDNPETIAKARRTLIYALIGLAIAVSAEAIVLTVLGSL